MSKFLSKIAHDINVCDYLDYKLYFRAIYEAAKKERSDFTYILFTEELGLGHSNLMNLIVNGKRKLSRNNAQTVVASLNLVLERRRYFLRLIDLDNSRNMKKREQYLERIIEIRSEAIDNEDTRKQLQFYSHWLHAIVFEMIGTSEIPHDAAELAARLVPYASVDDILKSLNLLESLELVERDKQTGQYKKIQAHFIMDDKIQNLGTIAFHNKMIDLAKDALVRVEDDKRDISSLTLAVPRSAVESLKKTVEQFQSDILAMAEKFDRTEEVYQINIQLFPLTGKAKRK